MSEFDALDSFSNALRNPRINMEDANETFHNADKHRGKMYRALEDANMKREMLGTLNGKLQHAVRMYDSLLERKVSQYAQQQPSPYQHGYLPQRQVSNSYYPSPHESQLQRQTSHTYPAQTQLSASTQHFTHTYQGQPMQDQQQAGQATQAYHPSHEATYSQPQQYQPLQAPPDGYQYQQSGEAQQLQSQPQGYAQHMPQQQPYNEGHQQQQQYRETHEHAVQQEYSQPDDQYYNAPQANGVTASSPSQAPTVLPHVSMQQTGSQDSNGYITSQAAPYRYDGSTQQYAAETSAPMHDALHNDTRTVQRSPQAGNPEKVRLQGYYTPSSFPSVPSVPVGGLPSAPNADFTESTHQGQSSESPKKQEAALIEF